MRLVNHLNMTIAVVGIFLANKQTKKIQKRGTPSQDFYLLFEVSLIMSHNLVQK